MDSLQHAAATKENHPIHDSLRSNAEGEDPVEQDMKDLSENEKSMRKNRQRALGKVEGHFDFKHYEPDGQKLCIQAIHIVEKAKSSGGDQESLLKETQVKFMKAENSSAEYRFYGAVINEIRFSLKERLEERTGKSLEKS
ncbi:hypothetical protein N0V93_006837 [Gnomoniopsis smithogilvyi]|uniref:Uncharacterized protein n=1 Tax=Gnomoniopsis smithogilvyi TaxID=1191159 RepID=A0A9W8YSN0_9PEZI|nr:hypothetical protein N0V93_006837 [Gnomoniopsis smithogilvyi]